MAKLIRYVAVTLLGAVLMPIVAIASPTLDHADEVRARSGCQSGQVDACERMVRHYDALARAGGAGQTSEGLAWKSKIDWAEKSCRAGGPYGCDAAGWAYEHGQESRKRDVVKAHQFYRMGCAINSPLSCNNLALAQRHGRGVPANEHAARVSFAKACRIGYQNACSEPKPRVPETVAKPVRTAPAERLSLTNKLPISGTVSFNAEQVPQSDYEAFMACAGQMHGGYAIGRRIQPRLHEPQRQQLAEQLEKGKTLLEFFDSIAHDLPIMALHLDRNRGQAAFNRTKAGFDATAPLSVREQEDFYVAHGTLSPDCIALSEKFVGLQSIYYSAQKSLE
ncbi:MAG: hypothetical protein AAF926_09120 [Pseudomonadota bacterium]